MGCCGKARDSVLTKKLKKILLEALEEDELLGYSATGLAKALKEGHTTALHLVALFTKHIEKVNPYINSVCGRRYKDAVFDANEADRKINLAKENGQLDELFASKPFLGVPYIAKEVLESPGLPITAGIVSRKGLTGKRWCLALKRLNEAGAILIATGNVSEGCMWYESDNKVYGRSNNPHDLSRTAGGSSGGNSALVAAYCAPFAISSDVGGSIRIPSFFNGLFGHKASGGSVPNAGMSPGAPGIVERYCQLGPSCRHVEDLLPLLQIISGKVSEEESTQCSFTEEELQQMKYHEEREWKCSPGVNIFTRRTKILLVWDQPKASLPVHRRGQDLIEAQRRVVNCFKENGNEIVEVKFKQNSMAFDLWSNKMLQASDVDFASTISEGKRKISPWLEVVKCFLSFGRLSDHTLPALVMTIASSSGPSVKQIAKLNDEFASWKEDFYRCLEGDTMLIAPPMPTVAPKHGPVHLLPMIADVGATAMYNVLELPVTQVPTGLNSQGLPTGVQIVAGYGKDDLTISAATFLYSRGVSSFQIKL